MEFILYTFELNLSFEKLENGLSTGMKKRQKGMFINSICDKRNDV